MISLSILIPLYNEKNNLPKLFAALEAYIKTQTDFLLEIIFINDGSTDETESLIRAYADNQPEVTVVSYPENKGRGYALRTAMLAAKGDWRVVLDADLAAAPTEMHKIIPCIASGADVIVGSRRIPGARVEVPPSTVRYILGMGYIYLARIITGVYVSDYSCGFKAFSRKASGMIFPHTKINRWAHDAENLYLAKKYGLKICEVPLIWRNGKTTTVRVVFAVVDTFIDLVRIRFIHYAP